MPTVKKSGKYLKHRSFTSCPGNLKCFPELVALKFMKSILSINFLILRISMRQSLFPRRVDFLRIILTSFCELGFLKIFLAAFDILKDFGLIF